MDGGAWRASPWGGKESDTTERLHFHYTSLQEFSSAPVIKNPPAKQEMQVRALGREAPLEREMAAHSSILAWRIPWTEEPGGLQPMWVATQSDVSD